MKQHLLLLALLTWFSCLLWSFKSGEYRVDESRFVIHESNPSTGKLRLFWKDDKGKVYGSINNLKTSIEAQGGELLFAMNGGMYQKDQSPQGLFIDKGIVRRSLNRRQDGYGNFYLQPNGVFFLTHSGKAQVISSQRFKNDSTIKYATQSGPMLLVDGQYHPSLKKGSKNLHIRNGVGILPDGKVLFAMSKKEVNFYDLATLFKQRGCQNALYLDGFVSRTYLPAANWKQLDGRFGVIIGEIK